MRLKTLVGMTFGSLTVVYRMGFYSFPDGRRMSLYLCRCSCGKTTKVLACNLKSGHTRSCGCAVVLSLTKHGLYNHPIYYIWHQMQQRCYNTRCKAYKYYGARGIKICKRWRIFSNFVDDMLSSWSRGMSIERKKVNGHYSPANCKWIPRNQQPLNTRRTRYWLYKGKPKTTSQLADLAGVNTHRMYMRLVSGTPAIVAINQLRRAA